MKYHSKNRKDMISRSYRFMMRMVVLSVTLLLASNVMAQKLRPFVYIGIGGAEYDSNGTVENSWKLGGGVEWQIHKHWGLRPMLDLTRKGADELVLSNYRESAWYARIHYAELPVVAYYTGRLSKKWTVQAGAGPYAAYGLWGDLQMWGNESYDAFGSDMNFKRFDYGCQLMAQVRKKHWAFSVLYEKGFVKLTDKFYKISPYNRAFNICGTYYF